MERSTMPFAVGGAVALAMLMSVLGSKSPSPARQTAKNSAKNASAAEARSPLPAESTVDSLARDSSGPWYALCQEFNGDDIADGAQPSGEDLDEVERTVTNQTGVHKYAVHKAVVEDLTSCYGAKVRSAHNVQLQFLITTLPDPIQSHLDIEFDRALESLTRAAEIRGYSFERYWLPWRPKESGAVEDSKSKDSNEYEESLRREQPGLLIYRKLPTSADTNDGAVNKDQLLLIFLVGETPTAGLNRPAFLKAVRYIERLSASASAPSRDQGQGLAAADSAAAKGRLDIPVAGPIFSGTLPSLGETIAESVAQSSGKLVFHVVDYSARSGDLLDHFQQQVRPPSTVAWLDLKAADAEREWVDYMCSLHYDAKDMAVLAEEGSAYGNAATADSNKPPSTDSEPCGLEAFRGQGLALTFPRDLSAIRNLSADQSSSAPAQPAGVDLPSIGVALTLRQDQTNEHDAPPDFAQAQSSARIDRALRGIVKTLHTRRTQAVLVTATNPLDRVFLLEYLHLMVPDARLATVGADDFMLARPGHIDLSGTIAVTSLPLTENAVLLDGRRQQVSINFPSNAAEGVFLAAANLLGSTSDLVYKPVMANDTNKTRCADISIVGKTGFRPAITDEKVQRYYPCFDGQSDTLTAHSTKPESLDSVIIGRPTGLALTASKNATPSSAPLETAAAANHPLPLVWIMALLAALVGGVAHITLVCSSNEWAWMGFLPKVRRLTLSASHVREIQLLFLFFATGQVVLVEWIALTTTVALQSTGTHWYHTSLTSGASWCLLLLLAHIVLFTCSAALCAWLLVRTISGARRKQRRAVELGIAAALLFVLFTAACWLLLLYRTPFSPDLAKLSATRSVYLFEGLSPLVPMFFVLLAYYLWSLNSLEHLHLVAVRVSLAVPRDGGASAELADRIADLQASIRPHIDANPSVLALLGLAVVGACVARLWPALRGFEHWAFRAWLITGGFGLLLIVVVIAFCRAWNIWLQLKKVLHLLDAALLGRAFSHVPKDLASVRVWSFGSSRTSLMVQIRTAELLQRIEEKYPMARAQAAAAVGQAAATVEVPTGSVSLTQSPEDESAFLVLRKIAHIMDCGGVLDRPLAKKLSELLNARMPQTAFLFSPELAAASSLPAGEKNLLELYVAYRFVAFFHYVVLQLRNKLTFVVYGFACLVVGASVYPFQGRESLGTLMTSVFVLLLAGVAAVIIQMYRDPILKRLEEPSKGIAETFEIVMKLIGVAGVPLFAVLASQFPSLAEFLLNWLQPLLETSH